MGFRHIRSAIGFFLCFIACVAGTATPAAGDPPLATVRVASGLAKPAYAVSPPNDTSRLFVLELDSGKIRIIKNGSLLPTPFMTQGGLSIGNERGLLGMAFHPSYAENGYFYLHYTTANGGATIRRYTVSPDPDRADTTTGVTIMTFTPPQANHNGGWIGFANDGYLYVAKGDAALSSNAQSNATRNGKILRIDVDGGFPYTIPPTNPFAGMPSPANEIWAKGLRNPWRCSFDRDNYDLYIGDVGDSEWEELNYQIGAAAGGANYGWDKFEGFAIQNCPNPCDSSGLTRPVAVFGHFPNPPLFCAITGGYVYRGPALPGLQGAYFYGDYCTGWIYTLRFVNGQVTQITDRTAELDPGDGMSIDLVASFGEDALGEIYICDIADGEVYKIIGDPTFVGVPIAARSPAPALGAAAPNPSGYGFAFDLDLPAAGTVGLHVHDASGRLVATLLSRRLPAGLQRLGWDGMVVGGPAPAGVYFLRLETDSGNAARKLTVVR